MNSPRPLSHHLQRVFAWSIVGLVGAISAVFLFSASTRDAETKGAPVASSSFEDADVVARFQTLIAARDFERVLEEAALQSHLSPTAASLEIESALRAASYQKAAMAAEDLRVRTNNHPDALLLASRAAYALGDFEIAARYLSDALRADAGARRSWLFRARVALDANKLDVASSALARAAEAGATSASIEAGLIEIDIRRGEVEAAATALQARAAAWPEPAKGRAIDVDGAILEARLAFLRGDGPEANRRMNAVADRLGERPRGVLIHAVMKAAAGDDASAHALLERATDAAPADWVVRDLAALFFISRKDFARAEKAVDALVAMRPDLAAVRRRQLTQMKTRKQGAAGAPSASASTPLALACASLTADEFLFGRAPARTASVVAFPEIKQVTRECG